MESKEQTETQQQIDDGHKMVEDQLKQIYVIKPEIPTSEIIKGYDFNEGVNWDKLFDSYKSIGLQCSHLAQAVEEIKKMIFWRLSDEPLDKEKESEEFHDPEVRKKTRCTIFLGYTSNMISCGMREIIRFLVQHKMVDCIVTSSGGIEEDFIKCMQNFHMGKWECDDKQLRLKALHRIGNILVPSEGYIQFEAWITPIFEEMHKLQQTKGIIQTPSSIIRTLGQKINNEESVYYWAAKNNIPVYCPAITDGAIGDMLYFFSYKHSDFIVDVVRDVKEMNQIVFKAKKSGVVIIGGGMVKHHILNANIWRNGADYGVFINTGLHHDGSDAGAMISEALTWGKMRLDSSYVKIFAEASLIFPIIVGQTFAKYKKEASKLTEKEQEENQTKKK